MTLIVLLLVAAVAVVAAAVVGAVVLAGKSKQGYIDANQVIPGRPTRAPSSWAGSHDPEALLHRRLRDAMRALRANQAFDDNGALLDVRVELEEQSLLLDDELVAVAALPKTHRHDPLARVTEAVDAIEIAVAELASRSAVEAGPRLQEVLRRIRQRTSIVDEIRAELDQLPEATATPAPLPSPSPSPLPSTSPAPAPAPSPSTAPAASPSPAPEQVPPAQPGAAGAEETGQQGQAGSAF